MNVDKDDKTKQRRKDTEKVLLFDVNESFGWSREK